MLPETFAKVNRDIPTPNGSLLGRQTFIDVVVGELVAVSFLDRHRLPQIASQVYDKALAKSHEIDFDYALAAEVIAQVRGNNADHPLYKALASGTKSWVGRVLYSGIEERSVQ